ncbi:MAG: zf-HC2 domain-containing protein [Archangium sp.]|nr:zf-HC2 domain-containing protein [Archangium sp.]
MDGPTCKQSVEMMLEYLDGALTDDMLQKLQAHLGGCTPCEEFLASYRATPQICRKALARKMPDTVANKLTEFLRKELKR